MIREPFANGNSLIHRLDPRLKVLCATVYSCMVAVAMQFDTLLSALTASVMLVLLAKLRVAEVAKRVCLVNGLILFFWVVLPLTFTGEPFFHLGPLAVTRPGVILAAQITLKSNAILLAFISLIASMPFTTFGHALSRFRIPPKMLHLLLLTYRYVFVIEEEYLRLARATKIRGFRPGTNVHTYRTYAYLVGMLFVRALARAERVHQAMLCRGFKGKFYSLHTFELSRRDWIWSGLMITLLIGLAILEWIKTT